MTLAVQLSVKKSDGTIYVIGGDDVDSFDNNLVALFGGDRTIPDAVLEDMMSCFTPTAAGGSAGYYTPPGGPVNIAAPSAPTPGGQRISTVPVAVKIPWPEKGQADPYLNPLKASRQAQWDAPNKQWILMPGVDLSPFARWLPPGV